MALVQEIETGFDGALGSRTPFVVRGAAADWPARQWTLDTLRDTVESNQPTLFWYDLPIDHPLSEDLRQPTWLADHWDQLGTRLSRRDKPLRFWLARKGTRTPWHYDGNALDVINVQLSGAKHFKLCGPQYEMPWVRFRPVSTLGYEDTEEPILEATLNAGDLIYIPRFWSHYVRSLEETNNNINWVWTDTHFVPDPPVAVRECERMAAIRLLDNSGLLETRTSSDEAAFLHQELETYGGSKRDTLIAHMLDTVSPERVTARAEIEIANEPFPEFFSRLEARGRELHGRARRADDYFVDA